MVNNVDAGLDKSLDARKPDRQPPGRAREAVGIFKNINELNQAVEELEKTEFPRGDISIIAGDHEVERKFGTSAVRSKDLEDNPAAPRSILIRPEEKVIGAAFITGGGAYAGAVTALLLAGMASGTSVMIMAVLLGAVMGGFLGAAIAWAMTHHYKKTLEERLQKGGLVLWVRTDDKHRERLARTILKRHGGMHVHAHDI